MKLLFNLILLFCLSWAYPAGGQTNFREAFENANPVGHGADPALEEKLKVHQDFLDKARLDKDTLRQLYGNLYLFVDYARAHNFPAATQYILEAQKIADASGNAGWKGWVIHRKGILAIQLQDFKTAITCFKTATTLCGEAGDSLCVAESLEQTSAMYGRMNDFVQAQWYFEQALPLIEKYGDEANLAATLNNYGIFNSNQKRAGEAIPYIEHAADIYHKIAKHKEEAQALNNLAEAYYQLHRYAQSIVTYQRAIQINKAFNLSDNLISNYNNLSVLYEETGDYKQALSFTNAYYALRDTIIGAETRKQIADLELKYASQQKELELQKSQVALGAAQRSLERGSLLFFFLLLLVAFGIWRWMVQTRMSKRERLQNQENLSNLTRILLDKNTRLAEMEAYEPEPQPNKSRAHGPEGFEENLYNQRILTEADWSAFKIYFEKAYPGYLLRLRTAHPALTDAEERLSLFIKLQLTNKEAAAILGISAESVKKTRTRLRKRLELEGEQDLDEYIRNFKTNATQNQ